MQSGAATAAATAPRERVALRRPMVVHLLLITLHRVTPLQATAHRAGLATAAATALRERAALHLPTLLQPLPLLFIQTLRPDPTGTATAAATALPAPAALLLTQPIRLPTSLRPTSARDACMAAAALPTLLRLTFSRPALSAQATPASARVRR